MNAPSGTNNQGGMLTVAEALAKLIAGAKPVHDREIVSTMDATGRVLAFAQYSTINVPDHDNTSMDGYAVRAADCVSGNARLRVAQRIPAGAVGKPLDAGTAARIFTGAPIPPHADAVVMQEMTETDGDHVIVKASPKSGEWIRRVGEADRGRPAASSPAAASEARDWRVRGRWPSVDSDCR